VQQSHQRRDLLTTPLGRLASQPLQRPTTGVELVANQPLYSMLWRVPEAQVMRVGERTGIGQMAFAPLGHGMKPGLLENPVILSIAARVGKTAAQVLLAWAVQRGTALLTTPTTAARARENFDISSLPQDALDEINRIQTRQRLNAVVTTGVPGFIPRAQGA